MDGAEQTDISLVVADDHPLVAQMLALVLRAEDDFRLLAECRDGQEALDAILAHSPDVAVIDIGMPRLRGPEVARRVREAGSPTRLVFITGQSASHALREGVEAGARGFLNKTAPPAEIVAAIRTVAAGGTAFPRGTPPELIDHWRQVHSADLTTQERRVLHLAAAGHSTADIAAELYIGQTTVKTHLRHAAERLGVRGRAAAIAEAIRRGLIG